MKVENLNHLKVRRIATSSFSACISNEGDLYVWGVGSFGEW